LKLNKRLTSVEALGLAINREREAVLLYRHMSGKIKNRLVKRKIIELAKEESHHVKLLTDIYSSGSCEKPQRMKTAFYSGKIAELNKFGIEELIGYAIKKEKEAVKFYRENAKLFKDQSGRFMFEYLSGFEKGHQIVLEEELKAIKRFPEWMDKEDILRATHIGP